MAKQGRQLEREREKKRKEEHLPPKVGDQHNNLREKQKRLLQQWQYQF